MTTYRDVRIALSNGLDHIDDAVGALEDLDDTLAERLDRLYQEMCAVYREARERARAK